MNNKLKIFCAIQPFDFMQTIYTVREDGAPTKIGKVNLDNLPSELLNCCLHYDTDTILLTGEHNFVNNYALKLRANTTYSTNNIKVEVI